MKKIFYSCLLSFFIGGALTAQTVTLANFDFNGGTSFPIAPVSTATNITASVNGNQTNAAYGGTATGSAAFIQNTTAGNALSMSNSSGNNITYWTLSLSGSDINKYMAFKIYFQSEHSSTGATAITISYGTDGSTFTALSQTVAPGLNTTFTEATVDLSGATALNGASNIYIRLAASGASSTGTLRIDNLQVQGSVSAFETNGSNITFNGRVGIGNNSPSYPLDVSGDARITGTLMANGLTATSTSLSIANPAVFGSTIKSTSLTGTGSRLLLTDATGLISPLTSGTASQVLYGNGTWGTLPAPTFITTGSNAYFTGGNLGIGISTPTYSLDVAGTTRLGGNTSIKGNTSISGNTAITGSVIISSLGGTSGGSFLYVDSAGNLRPIGPISLGTNITHCTTQSPWMIGGNTLGTVINAVIGTCDNHNFVLEANNIPHVWIQPNGFVGFGNPFPGAIVDITTSGTNTGLNVGDASGTSLFAVTSAGKVGISNTTPSAMLDITTSGTTSGFNISNSGLGVNLFSVSSTGDITVTGNVYANSNILAPGLSTGTFGTGYSELLIDGSGNIVKSSTTILSSTASWNLGGNGTHAGSISSSIGTTDATDFPIVTNNLERMRISATGNVIVGIQYPRNLPYSNALFTVNGSMVAKEVFIEVADWADYVFKKDYQLMPLSEVEKYYKTNNHLPEVPSEKEMKENGMNVGDISTILLKKIEELTLYTVELEKKLKVLEEKVK